MKTSNQALLLFLVGCVLIAAGLLDIRFPDWSPPSTLDFVLVISCFSLVCAAGIYLRWYVAGAAFEEGREKSIQQIGYACPYCGQRLPEGSRFCNNCGYKIRQLSQVDRQSYEA